MIREETNKLYGLDHLRALAITLVLFYHYRLPFFGHPEWLTNTAKFGWTGVDLFFVLSGFLISSQLFARIRQGKVISLKEFFLKRFFRIMPAYWAIVAIYFYFPSFHEREALPPVWKFLTFTQNFGMDIIHAGTFSHAWSLCVEEHFYLLLPLVLIFLQITGGFKKSYWLLILLFAGGFVIRNLCWNHYYIPVAGEGNGGASWFNYVYYPSFNRLDGLLIGVSIAALVHFAPATWKKVSAFGNLLLILSLLVLSVAWFVCDPQVSYSSTMYGFPMVAIGYGLMVMGAISPSCFLYKWNSHTTTIVASLSYGIYLSHKGIIHIMQELLGEKIDINSNLMFFICMTACVAAAWLLNITIEKPFMNLRKRILEEKKEDRFSPTTQAGIA